MYFFLGCCCYFFLGDSGDLGEDVEFLKVEVLNLLVLEKKECY